jgi:flagella basal body P-ring formation protein FlgA
MIFLSIAIVIASFFSLFVINNAHAASLKSVSVISADVLTLGDLFDNVERNADYVIGPAPQPGKDMTLNARTLYRIASALDLAWRPSSTADHITVRREATVVSYSNIENTLRKSLKDKGVSGHFGVKLNNGEPSIILPTNMHANVEVSEFKYDRNRDYFHATLVAPSKDNPIKEIRVSGQVDRRTTIPVLITTLQHGDIISDSDIDMIEISQNDIQHNMITNKKAMIGMTPRRIAYAGKFLQNGALIKPQLVKRGDSVGITFQEGPLTLSAKGKALQSGAIGDVVRVTNSNSSLTVDAVVSGENQVVVN